MLLVHLSDIHFKKGQVETAMDPNASLRNELVLDAAALCKKIGAAPDAVLVSGDVAFAGEPEEYVYARAWLEQFCAACGANLESVFVIPGNHDVLRKRAGSALIQSLHDSIKASTSLSLEGTMRGLLMDEETAIPLYESIAPYNDFASQFFCSLLPPERTIAKRDLVLNDGSTLRLSGLNSAFVSSAADKPGDLFVDPASFQLRRENGVEHLVMCHHPYSWLRNGNALSQHLSTNAKIHLFGHEHSNRIAVHRDFVQIAASAVHPDKTEGVWEPGYNLIELRVEGGGAQRSLEVSVHVRVWQQNPDEFRAKTDGGNDTFNQSIPLDGWEAPKLDATEGKQHDAALPDFKGKEPSEKVQADPMDPLRDIGVRFFKLTLSQKLAITGKLNLIEEEDAKQPDFERFRRAFIRAQERNQIEALDEAVRAASN